MAPYGSWPTPITSELVVRGRGRPRRCRPRRRHRHVVRAAARGGRAHPARAADGRRPGGRPAPRGGQRPHGGARVRRRGVVGGRAARCGSPTGPTSGCTAHRAGDARAGHARARGPPGRPVGRRRRRRRAVGGCSSCASTTPRAAARRRGQRDRRARHLGRARAPGARDRPRLRVRPPHLARRHPAVLAAVVAPRHAVGRHRAVRRRPARRPMSGPALAHPQVVAGRPDAAPGGTGDGESVGGPRWADDGSLWFVSDRSGWWNLYRWIPPGPTGIPAEGTVEPMVHDGRRDRRPPVGLRPVALRVPVGRAGSCSPTPATGSTTSRCRLPDGRGRRPRPAVHVVRLGAGRRRPGRVRRWPRRPPSPRWCRSRSTPPARSRRPEVLRPPRDLGPRRRLVLGARADLVPHQRRPHRPRALLPADQPRR